MLGSGSACHRSAGIPHDWYGMLDHHIQISKAVKVPVFLFCKLCAGSNLTGTSFEGACVSVNTSTLPDAAGKMRSRAEKTATWLLGLLGLLGYLATWLLALRSRAMDAQPERPSAFLKTACKELVESPCLRLTSCGPGRANLHTQLGFDVRLWFFPPVSGF